MNGPSPGVLELFQVMEKKADAEVENHMAAASGVVDDFWKIQGQTGLGASKSQVRTLVSLFGLMRQQYGLALAYRESASPLADTRFAQFEHLHDSIASCEKFLTSILFPG